MQRAAHPILLFLLRRRLIVAPLLLLLALWLPGVAQGWFRTDAPVYAALSLNTYLRPLAESWSPAFGDTPYFNKPPLAFYLHGLSLYILGPTMLAARIPALLVAGATVVITALHAKSLTNTRTALLAGLVLASSLEFFRYTKTISLDLVLTLCLTATVALIARPKARTPHIYLAAIPLALALLTKPFVGLLAIPPLTIWLLTQHRIASSPLPLPFQGEGGRAKRGRVRVSPSSLIPPALTHLLLSTLLACALAAPWHIAMYFKHGQPFLDEYIGSQAVARITSSAHGSSPWFHYFQLIAESYWPWLIPAALACLAFARKRTLPKDKPAVTLALIWCAFWFVILSLSTDKSGRYLVPIYPLAAILCATWLASFFNRAQLAALNRSIIPITATLAIIAGLSNFIPSLVVHKPIDTELNAVFETLRKYDGADPIIVGPRAKSLASNIYLATGEWPEFQDTERTKKGVFVDRLPPFDCIDYADYSHFLLLGQRYTITRYPSLSE